MLILTRKMNESIMVGEDIQIKIVEISSRAVKLGIEAPKDVSVHRKEVHDLIVKENLAAGGVDLRGQRHRKSKEDEEKVKIVSLLEYYKNKEKEKQ